MGCCINHVFGLCSSDDLSLAEEEDADVKSFSFSLKVVKVLPEILLCTKKINDMLFMDAFRHLCIY